MWSSACRVCGYRKLGNTDWKIRKGYSVEGGEEIKGHFARLTKIKHLLAFRCPLRPVG